MIKKLLHINHKETFPCVPGVVKSQSQVLKGAIKILDWLIDFRERNSPNLQSRCSTLRRVQHSTQRVVRHLNQFGGFNHWKRKWGLTSRSRPVWRKVNYLDGYKDVKNRWTVKKADWKGGGKLRSDSKSSEIPEREWVGRGVGGYESLQKQPLPTAPRAWPPPGGG